MDLSNTINWITLVVQQYYYDIRCLIKVYTEGVTVIYIQETYNNGIPQIKSCDIYYPAYYFDLPLNHRKSNLKILNETLKLLNDHNFIHKDNKAYKELFEAFN